MSLIFTAVVPNHPKLLIESLPSATKDKSKTFLAIKELEGELYFMKPDIVVLLTSHGSQIKELIHTNISTNLRGTWPDEYPELHDIESQFHGDVEFAAHLKEVIDLEKNNQPMTIIADDNISSLVATPLSFLLDHLKHTSVVIISTGNLSAKDHFNFGEFIRHQSLQTNKRVAVIASGHLSEYNNKDENSKKTLDTLCLQFFKEKHPEKIININEEICKASSSDLLLPLSLLLGVVNNLNVKPELLNYEVLYEQGQIVANFVFQ